MEEGVSGPSLDVDKGQPNCDVLEPMGSTQISGGESLKGVGAFGESIFTKEWRANQEILDGTRIVEAKGLCMVASHVTLTDESLLEEASRHPSSLPRFLCALGSQDSPSSSFSKVERALVAASMGHDAPIRPNGEEEEEALDLLRVILADKRVMGCLPVLELGDKEGVYGAFAVRELGRGLTKEEGELQIHG